MPRTTALAALALAVPTLAAHADCGPFFFAPVQFAFGPVFPSDLKAVDLDHDGIQEIVYASRPGNGGTGITVIRRSPALLYTSVQFLPLPEPQTSIKFILEDADNDGNLDLIVTEFAAGSVRIHRGRGDATFESNYVAYAVGPAPTNLVLRDLNGDQRPDLVVTNLNDNTISVLMGAAGGGFFPRATYPAGNLPNFIALVDIDHDGRDDAITVVNSPSGICFCKGNGNGSFQAPRFSASATPQVTVRTPIIQDMTADGVPDIVAAVGGEGFVFFRGDPLGNFTSSWVQSPVSGSLGAVAVADFDMDGLPDVAGITGSAGFDLHALIYRNLGAPTFAAPLDFGAAGLAGGVPFATIMDRNNDGLADILWVDRFGQICIMEASGGGPVQILGRPQNQILAPGTTAEFGCTAAGINLTFQWFKNGAPVLNTARITGAATPLLQIQDVQPADSAVYECRISTGCDTKPVSAFLAVSDPAPSCPVDFNADGFVDFFDYDDFVQAFENGC